VIILSRIIDGNQNNIIGENVKKARFMRRMSQQQLADKLETLAVYICRGSISRIESGNRTVTDIEIDGLSQALDVSIEYLFSRKEN
jgi:transcriptional regulator with XRE-family HTH domain